MNEQKDLIRRFNDGKLSRRDFIKLALATGASATGIASVLAGCAPEPTAAPAPTSVPPTAVPAAAATEAMATEEVAKALSVDGKLTMKLRAAFMPQGNEILKVIIEDWGEKNNIPVAATKENPYSIDENLWGTSIECGVLEDPMIPPPDDAFQSTTSPEKAHQESDEVTIEFEKGTPIAVNGQEMESISLVKFLNAVGAKNAIGRIDLVENRLVGIKSREVYEAPAATILHFAHKELERLTLEKAVMHYKSLVAHEFSNLIYNGLWFSPLREALSAFVDKTQERVTGLVKVKLYKGTLRVTGRTSPYSLYDPALATYTAEDQFDHKASEGFIKIYGLPLKTYNRVTQKVLNTRKNAVA